MFRGTTPTLTFNVFTSLDLNDIDTCLVTIQSKSGMKERTFEDVDINVEDKKISITLTQEDTLYFDKGDIEIQIKLKMKNGYVYASSIIESKMEKILNEEVL